LYTLFGKKFKSGRSALHGRTGAKRASTKGFSKNPFFYFGVLSFVLFGALFFYSDSLALPNQNGNFILFNSFFKNTDNLASNELFASQHNQLALETLDLQIVQGNSLHAVSTPSTLTTQTLGDIFGGADQERKEVIDYTVLPGDTIKGLAEKFSISENTIAWANNISKSSALKVGESMVIPPINGVIYEVRPGDTLSEVAKKYKSTTEEIIAFNGLENEGNIFVNDVIFLPNGQMPPKPAPPIAQIPTADSFFIYPAEGKVTHWRHGFSGRAIDVANKCETPIYAAASGIIQRAQFNARYGNFITISHYNGTSTYYGHLQTMLVKSGQTVTAGQTIGFMGSTGTESTGCHLHFETRGTENFLAKYRLGATIKFKQ